MVERIVQEVMARLAAAPSSAVSSASVVTSSSDKKQLKLSNRVVTLDDVKDKLNAVKSVVVPPKAIVTPAARDYLREKGASLSYATNGGAAKMNIAAAFGIAETSFDPTSLLQSLAQANIRIEQVARSGLVSVTRELADLAAKSGRAAVLITSKPAAALALANRERGVRAVRFTTLNTLENDCNEVGANFLVANANGANAFELNRGVSQFLAGGPRPCPSELAEALK